MLRLQFNKCTTQPLNRQPYDTKWCTDILENQQYTTCSRSHNHTCQDLGSRMEQTWGPSMTRKANWLSIQWIYPQTTFSLPKWIHTFYVLIWIYVLSSRWANVPSVAPPSKCLKSIVWMECASNLHDQSNLSCTISKISLLVKKNKLKMYFKEDNRILRKEHRIDFYHIFVWYPVVLHCNIFV